MSNHADLVQRLKDYSQGARLLDKKAAVPEYPGWCREASDLFAEAAASLRDAKEVIEKVRAYSDDLLTWKNTATVNGNNIGHVLREFLGLPPFLALSPVPADEPKGESVADRIREDLNSGASLPSLYMRYGYETAAKIIGEVLDGKPKAEVK